VSTSKKKDNNSRVTASEMVLAGAAPSIGLSAVGAHLHGRFLKPVLRTMTDHSRYKEFEEELKRNPSVTVRRGNLTRQDALELIEKDFILKRLPKQMKDELADNLPKKLKHAGPFYERNTDRVYMGGVVDPDILAHEVGHAQGGIGKKVLQAAALPGKVLAPAGMYGGIIAGATAFGKDRDTQERRFEIARNLGLAGAAADQLPTLLEEARATGRATINAPKGQKLRRLKTLLPAYGTYVATALPSLSVPISAELLRRRAASLKNSESKMRNKTAGFHPYDHEGSIDPEIIRSFADEIEKLSSMTGGHKALLGTGLVGGGIVGAYGKDAYQDALEGKTMRKAREYQQRQQLREYNRGFDNE
jgi:hypothetical protein